MYKKITLVMLLLMMTLTALVRAQVIEPQDPENVDPNANISWPPPVYVLRGQIEVRGSANVANMINYYLEVRPLVPETGDPELDAAAQDEPWLPATLPSTTAVSDNIIGLWNTETVPDGLYEMRLVINISRADPIYFRVSPLRVENELPEGVEPISTLPPITRPTLAPSPTAPDSTPRVSANLDANVRAGDGVGYGLIGTLRSGQSARVLGISTSGNGWYYIELPNGDRGWIAPSVVTASGDLRSVPRISPPASPTPPPPPVTATPVPSGNLAASPPSINTATPTCNVSFQVLVNITNSGTTRTQTTGAVIIRDVHVASGTVQTSVVRDVPQLDPGQNWVVGGDLTVSTYFSEQHRIEVLIDVNNAVVETNEADNFVSTTYTLAQGAC